MEDYKSSVEKESFYKPQLRVSSDFFYVLDKKFTFNAKVYIQDDVEAKVYVANPLVAGLYPSIPDPSKETITTVKGFVDLGVGGDYKINNKFSVFAKVNNLLNTKYNKFLYYQNNGINIFGGLSYSF